MDLMNDIAQLSMQMKAADFAQNYSISVMKKVMETPEMSAELISDMMPAAAMAPKGQYIDVFV